MFVAPKNLFQLVRVSVDSLWNTFQAISDTSPMSAELLLTGFFSLFFRLTRFRLRRRIGSTLAGDLCQIPLPDIACQIYLIRRICGVPAQELFSVQFS